MEFRKVLFNKHVGRRRRRCHGFFLPERARLAYPVQLYGKLDLFLPFLGALDRENELFTSYRWRDFFVDRIGMTIGGGLRVEF